MKKVLGLMTCFNRKEKTKNAIEKLREGNPDIDFSFLVVDDQSTDGTKEAIECLPQVEVISGNGSLFYSGGMRVAIDHAKKKEGYEYCLLFNDDVDFQKGSIEYLAEKDAATIWVGPTCDDKKQLSYGGIVKTSKWRPKTEIVKADTPEGEKCDTFNANCVLIPWNIFTDLDNIDPVYHHSMGDFDYGFSAARKGYQIKVSDRYVGICIDNPVENSWRNTSFPRKKRLSMKESPKGLPGAEWFHYLNKNYHLFTAIVYSVIPYLRILLKR